MRSAALNARSIAELRVLAADEGYEIEHSTVRDCWRLIGGDGVPAKAPNGTKAFTVADAKAFLAALSDA